MGGKVSVAGPRRKKNAAGGGGLCEDLDNWMTNLPPKLRSIPIIHLAIPGSHDSFTSNISTSSEVAPDAEEFLKRLEWMGPLLKHFVVDWSKTQAFAATAQLKNGIRYFDLRIATKRGTDSLYIVHGLYSVDVQTVFDELSFFLEAHPQEVIILDCQHFYAFTQNDHEELMQKFEKTFGAKLLPYSDHMDFITLEYMTTQWRYQVIVIYRSDAARFGQPLLWPSFSFPTPWPNTMSKSKLFNALDLGLRNRPMNRAYISQCVLTPTCGYVFANLFSNLRQKCAIELEEPRLRWINRQSPGEKGVNIIIVDFIDLSDCRYSKAVISLNERLIRTKLSDSSYEDSVIQSDR